MSASQRLRGFASKQTSVFITLCSMLAAVLCLTTLSFAQAAVNNVTVTSNGGFKITITTPNKDIHLGGTAPVTFQIERTAAGRANTTLFCCPKIGLLVDPKTLKGQQSADGGINWTCITHITTPYLAQGQKCEIKGNMYCSMGMRVGETALLSVYDGTNGGGTANIWMNVQRPVYFGPKGPEETVTGAVSSNVSRPVMSLSREFGGIDVAAKVSNSAIAQNGTATASYTFNNKNSLLKTATVSFRLEPIMGVSVVANSAKATGGSTTVQNASYTTSSPISCRVKVPYGKSTTLSFQVKSTGKIAVGKEFPLYGHISIDEYNSDPFQYIYSSMLVSNPLNSGGVGTGGSAGGGTSGYVPTPLPPAYLVSTTKFDKTVYQTASYMNTPCTLTTTISNIGGQMWQGSISVAPNSAFVWKSAAVTAKSNGAKVSPTTGGGIPDRATIPANSSITIQWKGTISPYASSNNYTVNIKADSSTLDSASTLIENLDSESPGYDELMLTGTTSPSTLAKGDRFTLVATIQNKGTEGKWDQLVLSVPNSLKYVSDSETISPDPSSAPGVHALGGLDAVHANGKVTSSDFYVYPNSSTTVKMTFLSSATVADVNKIAMSLVDSTATSSVQINFQTPYAVTPPSVKITPTGSASVTVLGNQNSGWTITLTPFAGYELDSWVAPSGATVPPQGAYSFHTTKGDCTYTATMKQKAAEKTPPMTQTSPSNGGTASVKDNNNGIYTLTAVPNDGWTFVGWSCDNGGIYTYSSSISVPGDGKTYVAHFDQLPPEEPVQTMPEVSANPSQAGTASVEDLGNGEYRLTAKANDGYVFKNWKNSYGFQVAKNNPYTVKGVAGVNYVANFDVDTTSTPENPDPTAPTFATSQIITAYKTYNDVKYTLSLNSGDLTAGDTVHGTLRLERLNNAVPTSTEQVGIAVQTPYLQFVDSSLTVPQGATKSTKPNYNAVLDGVSVTYGQPVDIGFDALVTESVTQGQVAGITAASKLQGHEGVQVALNVSPRVEVQKVCTCETKCTEGHMNAQCDVCSQEGATLDLCQGAVPKEPTVNLQFEEKNIVAKPFEKTHVKVFLDAVNTSEPLRSAMYVSFNTKYFSIDPASVKLNNITQPQVPISTSPAGNYSLIVPPVDIVPTTDPNLRPSIEFDLYVLAKASGMGSSTINVGTSELNARADSCIVEFGDSAIQPNLTEYSGISAGVAYTATLSSANPVPGDAVDVNVTVQRLTDDTSPQTISIATDAGNLILDKKTVTVKNTGDDASVQDVQGVSSNADSQIVIEDAIPLNSDGSKTYTIHGYVSPFAQTGTVARVQVMPESSLNTYAPLSFTVGETPAIVQATHAERTFGNTTMAIDLDKDATVKGGVVNATVTLTPLKGSITDTVMVDVPSTASIDIHAATIRNGDTDCVSDKVYKSNDYDLIIPELKASPDTPAVVKFQVTPQSASADEIIPVFVRSGDGGMNIQNAAFKVTEALEPKPVGTFEDDNVAICFVTPEGTLKQGETVPMQIHVRNKLNEAKSICLKVNNGGMFHVVAGWQVSDDTGFDVLGVDPSLDAESPSGDSGVLPADGSQLIYSAEQDEMVQEAVAASTATETYMVLQLQPESAKVVNFSAKINEDLDLNKLYSSVVSYGFGLGEAHSSHDGASVELAPAAGAQSSNTIKADGVQLTTNIYQSNLDAGAAARVVMNLSKVIARTSDSRDVVFSTAEGLKPDLSTVQVKTAGEYTIPPEQISETSFQLRSLPVADEATEVSFVVDLADVAEPAAVLPITVDAGNGAVSAVNVLVDPLGLQAEPCNHEWGDWAVIVDPTCTQGGLRSRSCTICGNVEEEPVAPLGHDFQNGKCTRCPVVQSDLRKADNSKLIQRLADIETLNRDEYTITSWDAVLAAQAEGEKVVSDPNALQEQIDHAISSIDAAIVSLVPVEGTIPSGPSVSAPDVPDGDTPDSPQDNQGQTPSDPEDQSGKEGKVPESHEGTTPETDNQGTTPDGNNGQNQEQSGNADTPSTDTGSNNGSVNNQTQTPSGGNNTNGNASDKSDTTNKQNVSQNGSSVKNNSSTSTGTTLSDLAAQAQQKNSQSTGTGTSKSSGTGANTSATTTNSVTAPLVGSTTGSTSSSTNAGNNVASTGTPSSSTYTSSTSSTPVTSKVASKMPQTGIPAVAPIAAGIGIAAVIAVIARKKLRG